MQPSSSSQPSQSSAPSGVAAPTASSAPSTSSAPSNVVAPTTSAVPSQLGQPTASAVPSTSSAPSMQPSSSSQPSQSSAPSDIAGPTISSAPSESKTPSLSPSTSTAPSTSSSPSILVQTTSSAPSGSLRPSHAPSILPSVSAVPSDAPSPIPIDADEEVAFDERIGTSAAEGCEKKEHSVTVDLRIAFPDQFVITCDADDDALLLEHIQKSLKVAFQPIVANWDGTAVFTSLEFDLSKEIVNMEGFGQRRNRNLQQQLSISGICPERPHTCPASSVDSCRLACGVLTTTSCNGMKLSSVENLDNQLSAAITQGLQSFNLDSFPCLGLRDRLIALVRVDNDTF